MNTTDKINALREGGNIRRFHTWSVHGTHTIAHHSFNAVNLLLVLHPNPSMNLVKAVQWHDAPSELWTGDTPAPAKWHSNGLKEKLRELELLVNVACETAVALTPEEEKWLWAVDKIDLWLWVIEQENLGNKTVKLIHDRLDVAFSQPNRLPPECVKFVKNYKWKKVNVAELPE